MVMCRASLTCLPVICFGRAIEKIYAAPRSVVIKPAAHAVDDAIAESLQKRDLAGGFLELRTRVAQALSQIVREKRHRAESEDAEADDVLQRRPVGT